MHIITTKTMILIALFAIGYIFFLIRKTSRRQLDIYDLFMLSAVAVIPLLFVALPEFTHWFARSAGVEFPFVLMFGILFAILFIFIHRLTVKIHKIELDSWLLIQELSMLRQTLTSVDGNSINQNKNSSVN